MPLDRQKGIAKRGLCHWIDSRMLLPVTARIRNYLIFDNKECQSYDASLLDNLTQLVQIDTMDSGREALLMFS